MDDPTRRSALQQALRGHIIFRSVALLLGFTFQIVVVKVLSPGSYASYAVLLATLLVGERLLSFGTDRTILRFVPALLLSKDRGGLRFVAARLGLLRATGIVIFISALSLCATLHIRITPSPLSVKTTIAFGVWFVAYTLMKEADAVGQGLIIHHLAAVIAFSEVLLRTGSLLLVYYYSRSLAVETVILVCATTCSLATAALVSTVWRYSCHAHAQPRNTSPAQNATGAVMHRQVVAFAMAAYASTLSFLVSSAGVVRLVARSGLDVFSLAAFSFVQGLAASLAGALPGQLVLPSLESVVARMVDGGERERIFPMLSLLFKIELTCTLSIIIGTVIAGPAFIGLLSRSVYAPFYYLFPVLMVGSLFQTIYRLLEILGSAHLKYKIFLTLWPLGAAAMIVLYLTVRRWGLVSVLLVPIMEIIARVGLVTFVLRHHGIWRALDPARSLRLVGTAAVVLSAALYGIETYGHGWHQARLPVAGGCVAIFIGMLSLVRPLSSRECDTLNRFLPASWALSRYVAGRLSHS